MNGGAKSRYFFFLVRSLIAASVSFPSSCPISHLGCPERENLKGRTAERPKARTAIDDSVKISDTMKVN
jgi:hypothetical protein